MRAIEYLVQLTMYDQTGNKELNVQAKILYNTVTFIK